MAPIPSGDVLGVDGMDPAFVERHWADLPICTVYGIKAASCDSGPRRLRKVLLHGRAFITGIAPSKHGYLDFVHRDPATLAPFSSMNRTQDAPFHDSVRRVAIALSAPKIFLSARAFRSGSACRMPECRSLCCACRRITRLSKRDAPSPGWECPTFVERTGRSRTSRMIPRSCRAQSPAAEL